MAPLLALLALAATPVEVLDAARQAGRFQGELLVAREGEVVLERGFGLRDPAQGVPHAPGATWRWASVTKQLTAVLVMQEVERGRLALDAPLSKVLPEFKGPTRERVTVRMLLQHTSGLPNPDDSPPVREGGGPGFYERPPANPALGYCAGPARGAPGAAFAYDNCDYLVLGAVLERLAGRPFEALVQERLARPLGLTSLRLAPPSEVVGTLDDGSAEGPLWAGYLGAAGGLGGTLRDLWRFDVALREGKLLGPKALAQLWAGEPRLGMAALGQWSYQVRLSGCGEPVKVVERRGALGAQQVANLIAPQRAVEVLLFSSTARTELGSLWEGKGLLAELLASVLCGEPGS